MTDDLSPGQVLILGQRDVRELLTMRECMDAMAAALRSLAQGQVILPLRPVMWLPGKFGALGMMPAHSAALAATGVGEEAAKLMEEDKSKLRRQARDWLSYLHSTAALVDAASPHTAGAHWRAALTIASDAVRQRLALAARRMRWLRHLPASRRFGRDTQRIRAVARLLARWHDSDRRARERGH